jgi:flagellar hook assembly protein FlgD
VVYLGIALEQISDEADRDSIVARSIRWFEEGTTGIGDDPPVSYTFQLNQNYPNPFNPETMIQYVLDNAIPQQTKLVVYNSLGQAVRTLVNASQPAGSYQVMWDGRDDYGKQQASGIYYYQLTNGSQKAVQKMIMLR